MKYPFVLTVLACVGLLTLNQTPSGPSPNTKCTLTREEAPEIRGVRLNMSTEQLMSVFPDETNRRGITDAIARSKQDEAYGMTYVELRPNPASPNPRFENVNFISVTLLDGRVRSFLVSYGGAEWKNTDQFVARLTEGLRLPDWIWESTGNAKTVQCNGFRIEAHVTIGARNSAVRVHDPSAQAVVEERREAEKEKARQAFRP